MVLRIDPRLPILWRTPSSVQVGSHGVAVLEEVSDGDAQLLAALAAGVSESGYLMLARSAGVTADRADGILSLLSAAFDSPAGAPSARAAVLGDSALTRGVAGLLSASGALRAPDRAEVVVLVGDWVIAPADHLRWLNRDVVHVPVVASELSVEVGPFVEPGRGPCLYCVHRARADEDAAWSAVATQLLGRPGAQLAPLHRAEVEAFVARKVIARLEGEQTGGKSWRLGADGAVSARVWGRHPDCRCAVPPETGWADGPDLAIPQSLASATGRRST